MNYPNKMRKLSESANSQTQIIPNSDIMATSTVSSTYHKHKDDFLQKVA
jgi:hypothetical protein